MEEGHSLGEEGKGGEERIGEEEKTGREEERRTGSNNRKDLA